MAKDKFEPIVQYFIYIVEVSRPEMKVQYLHPYFVLKNTLQGCTLLNEIGVAENLAKCVIRRLIKNTSDSTVCIGKLFLDVDPHFVPVVVENLEKVLDTIEI